MKDTLRLAWLSLRMIAGRRWWLVPVFVLAWPAFQALRLAVPDWNDGPFTPEDAQGVLIGVPLAVVGIGLGVRIIASEIDRRTLEIVYTVPGGAHRVWISRLIAALAMLLVCEGVLALSSWLLFTDFPLAALYGALQAASFYLVAAMALSTLFRSEATGALAVTALLLLNGVVTGFGDNQYRFSPFWNPNAVHGASPADLLAWNVQNRVGFLLAIAIIAVLAFGRAERRESMLAG